MTLLENLTHKNIYTINGLASVLEDQAIEARGIDGHIYIPLDYKMDDEDHKIIVRNGKLVVTPNPIVSLDNQHRAVFGKFGMIVKKIEPDYEWLRQAEADAEWDKTNIQYVVTAESATMPRKTEVLTISGLVPFMLFLAGT